MKFNKVVAVSYLLVLIVLLFIYSLDFIEKKCSAPIVIKGVDVVSNNVADEENNVDSYIEEVTATPSASTNGSLKVSL